MLYLDTSVLVPLFVPEPDAVAVRAWFDARTRETLAISDWTLTEFASAIGIKVRGRGLTARQGSTACALMNQLAAASFIVFTPNRSDFRVAIEHLGDYALALRAGDALHLAVARNEGAGHFYTLDQGLIAAGRKLGLKVSSPV